MTYVILWDKAGEPFEVSPSRVAKLIAAGWIQSAPVTKVSEAITEPEFGFTDEEEVKPKKSSFKGTSK